MLVLKRKKKPTPFYLQPLKNQMKFESDQETNEQHSPAQGREGRQDLNPD